MMMNAGSRAHLVQKETHRTHRRPMICRNLRQAQKTVPLGLVSLSPAVCRPHHSLSVPPARQLSDRKLRVHGSRREQLCWYLVDYLTVYSSSMYM